MIFLFSPISMLLHAWCLILKGLNEWEFQGVRYESNGWFFGVKVPR
jgi:hypothetical protein